MTEPKPPSVVRDEAQIIFPNFVLLRYFVNTVLKPLGYDLDVTDLHTVLLLSRVTHPKMGTFTRFATTKPRRQDYMVQVNYYGEFRESIEVLPSLQVIEEFIYDYSNQQSKAFVCRVPSR